MFSCVRLFATPRTVTCQAPLSMGFSRQNYWSGLPYPPPEDLLTKGLNPHLLSLLHRQWVLFLFFCFLFCFLPLVPSGKPYNLSAACSNLKRCTWYINNEHAAAAAKLLQSCPSLCDPIDSSPPGSSARGILQARILE